MTSLSDDLGLLGEMTYEGIRDFLVEEGITGVRYEPHDCPVSVWLKTRHQVLSIMAGVTQVSILDQNGAVIWHPTPASVRAFIDIFDHGGYPELELN